VASFEILRVRFWALKRGETCAGCGGTMRIIACIEDPAVIKAILAHLRSKARPVHAARLPPGRAPPAPVVS